MNNDGFIEEQLGEDLYDHVRAIWMERRWSDYDSQEAREAAFDAKWKNVQGFLEWTGVYDAVLADEEMMNAGARLGETISHAFPGDSCVKG